MSSKVLLPVAILAALLVLLPQPGEAQYGWPWMPSGGSFQGQPPFMESGPPNITCDQLNCAKGTCNINSSSRRDANSYSYNFNYSCQCETGWTLPRVNGFLPFLPCVLPNCTAKNCSATETPQFTMPTGGQMNYTDPCSWAYCGGGECVKKSDYTYACNCKPGFKNLFNDTVYPCFSDCSIGTECKKQGVGFLPATAGPPGTGGSSGSTGGAGSGSPSGTGAANTAIPNSFLGLLIMGLLLALAIA